MEESGESRDRMVIGYGRLPGKNISVGLDMVHSRLKVFALGDKVVRVVQSDVL